MRRINKKNLTTFSSERLREESDRLEEEIREARSMRLAIARLIESREEPGPSSPESQTVSPGFVESDTVINGRSKRWWQRG